jgi:hypothetical protein
MTYPLTPNHTIKIANKEHVLDGSFATLRALQEHFKKDILFIQGNIYEMRLDELASLIAIASGKPLLTDAIGQDILNSMDIMLMRPDAPYWILKTEIISWLLIAIAPEHAREKKRTDVQQLIEKQKASRGVSTANSASASLAGLPLNSGDPASSISSTPGMDTPAPKA